MLKKGVGRNSLNVYLSFDGFLRRVFSLIRAGEFTYSSGLKALVLLVQDYFRLFTRSLVRDSPPSVHDDICSKTNFLLPYFRRRKEGATSILGS